MQERLSHPLAGREIHRVKTRGSQPKTQRYLLSTPSQVDDEKFYLDMFEYVILLSKKIYMFVIKSSMVFFCLPKAMMSRKQPYLRFRQFTASFPVHGTPASQTILRNTMRRAITDSCSRFLLGSFSGTSLHEAASWRSQV